MTMDAAVAALVGAAVGAVVPAATVLVTNSREERRAAEDRQEARDARLFDHRRQAYEDFLSTIRAYLFATFDHFHVDSGRLTEDDWDELFQTVTRVELYGTQASGDAALGAAWSCHGYALLDAHDAAKYTEALDSATAFAKLARAELGIREAADRRSTTTNNATRRDG